MAHEHIVRDSDLYFQINPKTREIIHPSSNKLVMIQGDHNSERITLEIPRYVDGHDMSLCDVVEVHYINIGADGQISDIYICDDLRVSPDDADKVVCTWLVSYNATQQVGSISFALRYKCTSGDDVDYVWNTLPHKGVTIANGISNSDIVIEEYTDILNTWYNTLVMAGDGSITVVEEAADKKIAEIEAKGEAVKASLPEEYANLVTQESGQSKTQVMSQHAVSKGFANALKGEAYGKVIRVDDVSPIAHEIDVKVASKNLIPPEERDGATLDVQHTMDENGVIHLNGTASGNTTSDWYMFDITIPRDGVYYYYDFPEGEFPTHNATGTVAGRSYLMGWSNDIPSMWLLSDSNEAVSAEYKKGDQITLGVIVVGGFEYDDCTLRPTLFYDEAPTEYVPYVDPNGVSVVARGKNLVNVPDAEFTQHKHITINHPLPVGNYTLSGIIESNDVDSDLCLITFKLSDGTSMSFNLERNKPIVETFYAVSKITDINLYASTTYGEGSNDIARWSMFQIERGLNATGYEPYYPDEYKASSDGVTYAPSYSPTTTFYANNDNVTLDVEYNRDLNKVIADLEAKLLNT